MRFGQPLGRRQAAAQLVGAQVVADRLQPVQCGRGVGRALLSELCRRADEAGIWTIQAGILDGNDASVALHASCGFRVVGVRERLAQKRGRDMVKLRELILLLADALPLPPRYKDHSLGGNWKHHRDCHLEPDWLLIYKVVGNDVYLVRTGSHSVLF